MKIARTKRTTALIALKIIFLVPYSDCFCKSYLFVKKIINIKILYINVILFEEKYVIKFYGPTRPFVNNILL